MNKIYLNILGHKNYTDEELKEIFQALEKIRVDFDSILYESFNELKRKLRIEQSKRERRNWVWVEFICSWSGYSNSPSASRRDVGKHYRKLDKKVVDKMPKYFCHRFDDGSTNDWSIEVVSVEGKSNYNYANQVDKFLENLDK